MRIPGSVTVLATALALSLLPLQAAGQTCAANCTVTVGNGFVLHWAPQDFTTTIVAATVVQIVNTDLHVTRLSTVYNELPAGYTVPTNTNAQGTQTVPVAYVRTGKTLTTDVAFPTPFQYFPDRYTWNGTLPTTDANSNSICSTDASAIEFVDFWSQQTTFTTPTNTYGPDPGGLLFTTWWGEYVGMANTYKKIFTTDAALQSCSPYYPPAPAVPEFTARFITDTSVSYEGGSSSGGGQQTAPSSNSATRTSGPSEASSEATSGGSNSAAGEGTASSSAMGTITKVVTSTSLNTVVTNGPSGVETLVNTVDIISAVVSTPSSASTTTEAPANTPTNAGPTTHPVFWTLGATLMAFFILTM
ncbi:uncharacterized protein PV07_11897 [Cladophialophora immunda]|uniref:Uncharacterized protein n=1 Tax=Cladophialophora immunda TaxID=569365 RepID=A0A0D2CJH4_9EURO|nr:uncharacterized protein PV07_11897 [Cladophialophora immunda]KIW23719.1 hypothetical protein PV07_11897 [Cladophialophora immunda]OQV03356.1 hypothetical protein CLAIMM_08408 [Cladophialophora immunda]